MVTRKWSKKKDKQTSAITKGKRKTNHYLLSPPQQRNGRCSGKKSTKGEEVVSAGICKKTKNTNVSNVPKKKQTSSSHNHCKK